ncbi:MAG: hypothetical protein H7X71_02785 [Chitinophagales bacterium]|nr:hypothetical protein [Chitinophagales bacterium]
MFFKTVIGQERIKEQLIKTVQENRVSHAQLFLGPEGCGNLAMALAYAQYINCENKLPADSCGLCPSCTKSQKFIHPDIHFTFPFVNIDKKEKCAEWLPEWRQFLSNNIYGNYNDWIQHIEAENKQGNINAKECMDILHRLAFKTFESQYKILILWLPEFLEKEGNRLLKLLEEPPPHTVFLFVAHNADRIMNTILSRLQLVKFPRLTDDDIAETLTVAFELTAQQAKQISAMSDGNYREAAQLLQMSGDATAQNPTTLRNWMGHIYQRNIKELFTWNDVFAKWGRENQKNYFYYCIHFFREIILLQSGVTALNRLTDAEIKIADELSKVLTIDKTTLLIGLLDKSIYFIERNANAKIMITYISMEMIKIVHAQSPAALPKAFFAEWYV